MASIKLVSCVISRLDFSTFQKRKMADLLHTLTPTPVPFSPHWTTPPSRAMQERSGIASAVASGDGDPSMMVSIPAVAATMPAGFRFETEVCSRKRLPPETGASSMSALPCEVVFTSLATRTAVVGSRVVWSMSIVCGVSVSLARLEPDIVVVFGPISASGSCAAVSTGIEGVLSGKSCRPARMPAEGSR